MIKPKLSTLNLEKMELKFILSDAVVNPKEFSK